MPHIAFIPITNKYTREISKWKILLLSTQRKNIETLRVMQRIQILYPSPFLLHHSTFSLLTLFVFSLSLPSPLSPTFLHLASLSIGHYVSARHWLKRVLSSLSCAFSRSSFFISINWQKITTLLINLLDFRLQSRSFSSLMLSNCSDLHWLITVISLNGVRRITT